MLVILTSVCFVAAYAQDEVALQEILEHRTHQDEEMRDAEKSPLEKSELEAFTGLNYFLPDLTYRVTARFIKNENPTVFKMKTTTPRLPEYVKYGEVHFTLRDTAYVLEVYQNQQLMEVEGYEDYLFIPFTDRTNGDQTYEVGRYLNLRVPKTDELVIDFNLCYNPYCSYNNNYSCPIPPAVNSLPTAIRAGEKKYKSH